MKNKKHNQVAQKNKLNKFDLAEISKKNKKFNERKIVRK